MGTRSVVLTRSPYSAKRVHHIRFLDDRTTFTVVPGLQVKGTNTDINARKSIRYVQSP